MQSIVGEREQATCWIVRKWHSKGKRGVNAHYMSWQHPILQSIFCVDSRLCKVYYPIIACTQQETSRIIFSTQNVSHVTEDEASL